MLQAELLRWGLIWASVGVICAVTETIIPWMWRDATQDLDEQCKYLAEVAKHHYNTTTEVPYY